MRLGELADRAKPDPLARIVLAGNALLIPDGGMVGAAASTLLTEMVVLLGCAIALRKR